MRIQHVVRFDEDIENDFARSLKCIFCFVCGEIAWTRLKNPR